jgi:hypothetical protein
MTLFPATPLALVFALGLLALSAAKTYEIRMGDYYVFHKTVKSPHVVHYRFSPKNGDFFSRRTVLGMLSGLAAYDFAPILSFSSR